VKVENADLVDGLHLAGGGNLKVFEGLKSVISTDYPHLAPIKPDGSPNLAPVLPSFFSFNGKSQDEIKETIRASFV
jgi:hypothetical protein